MHCSVIITQTDGSYSQSHKMLHQENLHKMHFRFKLAVLLSELQLSLVTPHQFVSENGPQPKMR